MRKTVTLDADVEQMLRAAMRVSRRSYNETLNAALRAGLADAKSKPSAKRFKVVTRPLRLRSGVDPSRLNQLADELEAETFLTKNPFPKRK